MSGVSIVSEIVNILISGITGTAEGIGAGISAIAESLFLQTTGTGADAVTTLSVFGTLIIVFAAISLALGLCRLIYQWLTSLGSRNR